MMLQRSGEPPIESTRVLPGVAADRKIASAHQPLSVLVVDDEPLIRWSLRQGLTKRGHRVVEAGTAAETLHLLSAVRPVFDVVILDYRLPDRRDLSLLKAAREMAPSAAFLMMTAYSEPGMSEEAAAFGARAVVGKPFQIDAFMSLIESL
jgi:DNA-binding NtrC family response regulator